MPVSMMVPLKVRRSTLAAQRWVLVKVFVQHPKDSLEAMTTLFFSNIRGSAGEEPSCPRGIDVPRSLRVRGVPVYSEQRP